MTSSNGRIFRVTCHLCGEFTGHQWIPLSKPVTRSFDVFFNVRLKAQPYGTCTESDKASIYGIGTYPVLLSITSELPYILRYIRTLFIDKKMVIL